MSKNTDEEMLLDFLPTSINTVVPPKCSISTFLLLIGSLFSFFLFGLFSLSSFRHLFGQSPIDIFIFFGFFLCRRFLLVFLNFFLLFVSTNFTIFIAKQYSFTSRMALGTFLDWIRCLTKSASFSEQKMWKLILNFLHVCTYFIKMRGLTLRWY